MATNETPPTKNGNNGLKSAEEIFEEFKEHSVAEFFTKNKQMLGFSGKIRSLTTVIHEYVTNSLDACEEAGILPDITVKITAVQDEHYLVRVTDNGPGIPLDHIGRALGMMLSGTKFHRYMQQRGQQGIGATGCTMFAQLTSGKPIHIRSSTGNGKVYECNVSVNIKTNAPHVTDVQEYEGDFRGLEIMAEFADVKYDRSEYSPLEYLKRTAIANPHAEIMFTDPEGRKIRFPRVSEVLPQRPVEVQPHPLGIEAHTLYEMLRATPARKVSSFLTTELARVTPSKVEELRAVLPQFDFDMAPKDVTWEDARRLVAAFKKVKWVAPSADGLRPIGNEQIEISLRSLLNPEFLSVRSRPPKVYRGGVPFIIEVAICYGGKSGTRTESGTVSGEIMRFANRSPLLFDAGGCAITKAVKSVDWRRYELQDFDSTPVTVFVNIVSAFVPYTGAGKQSIAAEPEVLDEIKFAVMDVARDLQRYLAGKVREETKATKRKAIMRYIQLLAENLPLLANTGQKEELEKKLTFLVFEKFKADEAEEEKKEKKTRVIMEEEGGQPAADDGKIEFDEEDM
ncbi:MAG: DNA topoisomerase VI subunit B [Candidatus Micrarchaeota archaeon]|nr:DNA topoisomerase VI subunit B [Candidatus Micrarchaeota archaeon]